MQKDRIIITGFLHTGSSAFFDAFDDMNISNFIPFRSEYNSYREINGYYDLILSKSHSDISKTKFKLFLQALKQCLRVFYYSFSYKYKEYRGIKFLDLIKVMRFNFIKVDFFYKINRTKIRQEKIDLVNNLLDLENQLFHRNASLSIYAQPYLPEMDHEIVLKTFGENYHHFFITRNAFEQFYDIEKQNFFFGPYHFREEYLFGRDANGLMRRKYFCQTLLSRIDEVRKLHSLMPKKIIAYSYNDLIKDPYKFKEVCSTFLSFEFPINVEWTKLQPNKERTNIDDTEYFKKELILLGYDDELMNLINQIDNKYRLLVNKTTSDN